jgi:hypothetical protein
MLKTNDNSESDSEVAAPEALEDIMNRSERLFRPAWVLQLSNAELGDAFSSAFTASETRWGEANMMRRLEVLSNEIDRRELAGTWTDWKVKA